MPEITQETDKKNMKFDLLNRWASLGCPDILTIHIQPQLCPFCDQLTTLLVFRKGISDCKNGHRLPKNQKISPLESTTYKRIIRDNVLLPVVTLNCLFCGLLFTPKRKDAKTCSVNCRKQLNRKLLEEKNASLSPAQLIAQIPRKPRVTLQNYQKIKSEPPSA